MQSPRIDIARCTGCGLCVDVCLHDGLVIVGGVVTIVDGVECDWCGRCEAVCETGAIGCPFEIVCEE